MTEVLVYRNTRTNCWSLLSASDRRLLGHIDDVTLTDVKFVVQEAGRLRVLSTGRKNVHAFVRGSIESWKGKKPRRGRQVRYNPRETATFVQAKTGEPIFHAKRAHLGPWGVIVNEKP
jgi:hypothetical protein